VNIEHYIRARDILAVIVDASSVVAVWYGTSPAILGISVLEVNSLTLFLLVA